MTARYLFRRLADALVTLFGVAVVVFLVLRVIPGDEVTARFGIQAGGLSSAQLTSLREYYGLDQPLLVQFFAWLGSMFSGNFGISVTSGDPVAELILRALPVTVELAVLATFFGTALGVVIGVLSASRPESPRDVLGRGLALLGLGVPNFVLASAVIAVLSARFGYFPSAAGYAGLFDAPLINLQQQLYPAMIMGIALAAATMRTTRSAYLEEANRDYVRTAHGKGLSARRVRWRHILRNASIPIVTISGIQFGYLLGGSVIVEQIFALPGLGRLVLTAILQREYAVVQSAVVVIAAMFVLVNLGVDLLYARIDPRVKLT